MDNEWMASKPTLSYRHGIHLLPERWNKVLENDGKYFDRCNSLTLF